jgi:predicted nucleic acid-binding protein
MPVLDTQVLFALTPRDPKHEVALRMIGSRRDLFATDTAILEFQFVLIGRGRKASEIRESLMALSELLYSQGVRKEGTIDTDLFASSLDIQSKNNLSYFDSLIAASAIILDGVVIGDDRAFDQVPNLKRIGLG